MGGKLGLGAPLGQPDSDQHETDKGGNEAQHQTGVPPDTRQQIHADRDREEYGQHHRAGEQRLADHNGRRRAVLRGTEMLDHERRRFRRSVQMRL